jgi:two-component system, NarL family, response regulator DevR
MNARRGTAHREGWQEPERSILRVMIVDDYDVVRQGIKALLESTGEITIVAEASSVSESIEQAMRVRPDVVVMDVRLGSGSGVEATREIRSRLPDTRVLMLTSFTDDEALVAAMLAGASGYVLKEVRGGDIVRSVRDAATGRNLFESSTAAAATKRIHDGKHLLGDRLALLSPQEERILERVAEGKTNAEIAEEMALAEKTVKHYVSNVLMKLAVARRAEAAAYLARHSSPDG